MLFLSPGSFRLFLTYDKTAYRILVMSTKLSIRIEDKT